MSKADHPSMQGRPCIEACHKHDNVWCLFKCCSKCKTVDKRRRDP